MADPQSQASAAGASEITADTFASLLNKEFKPQTDRAKEAVATAVKTLAAQALQDTKIISEDAIASIQAIIAAIDQQLTGQVNKILHHADFQKLEGAWRGLHHLVTHTDRKSVV